MTVLVLGAGAVGTGVATLLVQEGRDVVVVSRSGTAVAGARSASADVSEARGLVELADRERAGTVILCTNPSSYARWRQDWPPVIAAVEAASRGRDLVLTGNLYAYGRPTGPFLENQALTPAEPKGVVRADAWRRILRAHDRGDLRAVEVRASDYFGPGAGAQAHLGTRFLKPMLASKTARVVGRTDVPHSWSYLPDIATTLVAAARYAGPWGRAWHVPSTTRTWTQVADELNTIADTTGRVRPYTRAALAVGAATSPTLREVVKSSYQMRAPFVLDSTLTEHALGVRATPWTQAWQTAIAAAVQS